MSAHWYLLQCRPMQQDRAEQHLQNQDFQTFVPRHPVKRVRRGKYITVAEHLFPGYVFIQLDEHSDWRALNATRGVSRVVSFNGRPHPVPQDLIAELQRRFSEDGVPPKPLFEPGEKVQITEGCFRHVEAIVKAVTADERIIVLMNIMHTQQAITLEVTQLAKAG
ncbi:transcription/translation regulatory transformer protein RfaH [Pseudohongiella spirulinae]|uniref:Transcription antitermination protein RfaH n=1 Tax=Pseudohongiella spirulinae TaxID=1249552 RepID=A0A0S2KDN1_9GAMM|nr:transcription/translation regulatory transformer protein RfaH [Pseudohongiella spirulinae]ALO46423.1 Transcription antitermination protein RfaH [Pseudohongiella spirulinae]